MSRPLPLIAAGLALTLTLTGCGLHPLYAGGGSGPVASALSQIEVAPIQGKAGWLMTNALNDRLGGTKGTNARYRLDVKLDDQIRGLGVRSDDSVVRERRILRARYQLIDQTSNAVLVDATAGSDAGIDVVRSEYATIAAENTALERLSVIVADEIVARIATYARSRPGEAMAPARP
ncbi:LPS assembly lipoprotein LptE [uncultured Sphingomonas sp.]|uniref:LPS assembly lipoprotein LptE n=1 Tax=uncultured Sphingomonas sp. TaxID=158754 RepID=UPI0025FF015A|nr:LPS assembly lipoprotein LptE [uncultured Sphingomonas sp.]